MSRKVEDKNITLKQKLPPINLNLSKERAATNKQMEKMEVVRENQFYEVALPCLSMREQP